MIVLSFIVVCFRSIRSCVSVLLFIISGASGYSKNAVHSGAVYLYQRQEGSEDEGNTTAMGTTSNDNNGFTLQSVLMPVDMHAYAYFGHAIYFRDAIGECYSFLYQYIRLFDKTYVGIAVFICYLICPFCCFAFCFCSLLQVW